MVVPPEDTGLKTILVRAIEAGDTEKVDQLLSAHPELIWSADVSAPHSPGEPHTAVTISGGSEAVIQCIYHICVIMSEVRQSFATTTTTQWTNILLFLEELGHSKTVTSHKPKHLEKSERAFCIP